MRYIRLSGIFKSLSVAIVTISICATNVYAAGKIPPDFMDPSFDCGNGVKGTDYRRNDRETNTLRKMVESAHFTVGVQRGEYGNAGTLEGDLNYVLNKFPNHPKALLVAAKNQMKPDYNPQHAYRKDRYWPKKECYFQHALRLAHDDPLVHLVIAIFYHQYGNLEVASRHYKDAVRLGPKNPEAHYNYGLFLVDNNQADRALGHAKQAYAMGYPLEGLKNRLKQENVWEDG